MSAILSSNRHMVMKSVTLNLEDGSFSDFRKAFRLMARSQFSSVPQESLTSLSALETRIDASFFHSIDFVGRFARVHTSVVRYDPCKKCGKRFRKRH